LAASVLVHVNEENGKDIEHHFLCSTKVVVMKFYKDSINDAMVKIYYNVM